MQAAPVRRPPSEARWWNIRDDTHHQVGDALNRDLAALEESHTALVGVLQHIHFNRCIRRTTVSDMRWRKLIDHFPRYRLHPMLTTCAS